MDNEEKMYDLVSKIPVTENNKEQIEDIKFLISIGNYIEALEKIKEIAQKIEVKEEKVIEEVEEKETKYPKKLVNANLERTYIGLLLQNPKLIMKYYFLFDICCFEDEEMLNLYKSVLFYEGSNYSSEKAKDKFNFSKDSEKIYDLKVELKRYVQDIEDNIEEIYTELMKLFILRKAYLETPETDKQNKIIEIVDYELYDKMTYEEIESAIEQINITQKFKKAVLSKDLTEFLESGESELANGLDYPFPILTSVFKGIRRGETMSYAMPSNSGKSRFAIYIAAYTALIHKKKVLIISNEMSEEKMKLCLITTIINNPEIQKMHGQNLHKTEGEILEFKFKPDKKEGADVDENGFVKKDKNEKQEDFVKRLSKVSSEFNSTIKAIEWASNQTKNSIYFINITDHTNDELQKVILNYYYKEKIEYIFYDTLKTDTANIGNPEEIKKTATILSNLAQNLDIFICSSLQLAESSTMPINLNVNDLAVSRTVKEVLDTLCLIKQISRDNYDEYEYSKNEIDTKFFDLEKSENPDIRYYACVVDKNRAGAKPKLVFKLNLAYNSWEELGYLRLKQDK